MVGQQPSPLPPPKCLRAMTIPEQRIYRAEARLEPAGPEYCLGSVTASTGRSTGSSDCESFASIDTGFGFGDIAALGQDQTLAGVVPDGVGAVVIRFAGQAPIVGSVVENVFSASGGGPSSLTRLPHSTDPRVLRRFILGKLPRAVQWLTAPGGPVIRTFSPPPRAVNAYVAVFRAINSQSQTAIHVRP
jgi:hypothetical protein